MIHKEEQNHIMTYRTVLTFVIGIIIPLVSGSLLAAANTNDGKIRLHQTYFWIVATSLPLPQGQFAFVIMNTLANITLAAVNLNMMQCLLQVVPVNNKTLYISIYTVLVTLSNAFMPLIGVVIYTKLGADLSALQLAFWIIFVARIISTGRWGLRWWRLRNRE